MKAISIFWLEIKDNIINTNYFDIDPEQRAQRIKVIIKELKINSNYKKKKELLSELNKLLVISILKYNWI